MAGIGSTADEQELREALSCAWAWKSTMMRRTVPDPNRTPQRRLAVPSHGRQYQQMNSQKCLRFVLRLLCSTLCLLPSSRNRRAPISLERDFHYSSYS
jgi:hypothetical protein